MIILFTLVLYLVYIYWNRFYDVFYDDNKENNNNYYEDLNLDTKNKKMISINPTLKIQVESTILLDYKFLSYDPKETGENN